MRSEFEISDLIFARVLAACYDFPLMVRLDHRLETDAVAISLPGDRIAGIDYTFAGPAASWPSRLSTHDTLSSAGPYGKPGVVLSGHGVDRRCV